LQKPETIFFFFTDEPSSDWPAETAAGRVPGPDPAQGGCLLQQPPSSRIWEKIFDGKIKSLQLVQQP